MSVALVYRTTPQATKSVQTCNELDDDENKKILNRRQILIRMIIAIAKHHTDLFQERLCKNALLGRSCNQIFNDNNNHRRCLILGIELNRQQCYCFHTSSVRARKKCRNESDDDGEREDDTILFKKYPSKAVAATNKVTIVGAGSVGMACAFSILAKNVARNICLIDSHEQKVTGERMDLEHGSVFLHDAIVEASSDYKASAGSTVCVVTAGVRSKTENESRLNLLQRNTDLMKVIIPKLVKYSPNTVILLVSNPVDILAYVSWKISGLPINRVLGSGTSLDTSRLRFMMGKKLGVAPTSCHAFIIGEHGDSSVAVWSGANVAGVLLRDLNPKMGGPSDPEKWGDIHKHVIRGAADVIKLKGYTSQAIGLQVANLVNYILANSLGVTAVSTSVKGMHGIDTDVFLSVPCVIGNSGVKQVIKQTLSKVETKQLQRSARILNKFLTDLKW